MQDKGKGRIVLTIDEYRIKRGISKNKIVLGAGLQRTQLQNYCSNKVSRVDLDVLARLCHYLDCSLEDLMHYEKEE